MEYYGVEAFDDPSFNLSIFFYNAANFIGKALNSSGGKREAKRSFGRKFQQEPNCSNRQPAKLRFSTWFEKAHAEPPRGGREKGTYATRCRDGGSDQVPGGWEGLAAPSPAWWDEGPTLGAEREGRAEVTALWVLPHGSIPGNVAASMCIHTHLAPQHGLQPSDPAPCTPALLPLLMHSAWSSGTSVLA